MPEMLVRLKKGKTTFEVMVEEGKVAQYREGRVRTLNEVLVADVVWVNASKGKRASAEQLSAAFGTEDSMQVLETIIRTGDSQESGNERKQKMAEKRQEVVAYLAKNFIDPASKRALPNTRVENALDQIKARIDPDLDAQRQALALVPKLTPIMAMKRGGAGVAGIVVVPSRLASAASTAMRPHATVQRETFDKSSCRFEVDVHAQDPFLAALARATKGDFEFNVDNPVSAAAASAAPAASPARKGKGKKGKRK